MPNSGNSPVAHEQLVETAVAWLAQRLPASWTVTRSQRAVEAEGGSQPRTLEAAIDVRDERGAFTTFVVEARRELSPRDVEQLFAGLAGAFVALSPHIPVLVVAPWLSRRTQERLVAEGVNYLDFTGNALIKLDNPALFVQTVGAAQNPEPAAARGPSRLRGPRAARVTRLLADVRPPYALRDIAAATGLTAGYVSRLLDALDRELLIERDPRGPVRSVAVPELLRHWAQSYDVFATNDVAMFVAPRGVEAALGRLARSRKTHAVVTGSFAAARRAPVAAPRLLAVYCDDVAAIAGAMGVLRATDGGNVAVLRPFDPVVWQRTEREGGITYAAASQVAVDCLTGNGRMPAEGEALLDWMTENEDRWRTESLARAGVPSRAA